MATQDKELRKISEEVAIAINPPSFLIFSPLAFISFTDTAYDLRTTKGTQTSTIWNACDADTHGYMIRYNGYASSSCNIKHMSDILIEEMEDNEFNRFPMNKPITLRDYRIYFGNTRYIQLIAQHFLRWHHRDTLDMTLEYEWLEVTGYEF